MKYGHYFLRAVRRELRQSHPPHDERFAIAEEYGEVVRGLWDTWEDGAYVRNTATEGYVQAAKLHVLDHEGEYFSLNGPLNTTRPPQGDPIIIQAGSSDPGQELAAKTADVVFTVQQTLEGVVAFAQSLKGQLAKYDRCSEDLAIMPGAFVLVGDTHHEADAQLQTSQSWPTRARPIPC